MVSRVYFRGTREQARAIIDEVRASLVGSGPDRFRIAEATHTAIGLQALKDVKKDFIRKARGGVGEDGVQWPRLSPETLAYSRRFGKGEEAALKKAAGLGRANRYAPTGKGLLTKAQLESWKKHFRIALALFAANHPVPDATSIAAAIAWKRVKEEGAKTKLEVYGNRAHEVLRDTGVLLNSLSPGKLGGDGVTYAKPNGPGGNDQVFQHLANGVIIGTNVPYAKFHQSGEPRKKLPRRPFLPDRIPQVWIDRWVTAASLSIAAGFRQAFEQGAKNA